MDRLLIHGGRQLDGEVRVSGAKNAALPILAAALMVPGSVRFHNLPHLNDVTTMIQLLGRLGVDVLLDERGSVELSAQSLTSVVAPYDLVRTMRASIVVLGPLLARCHEAEVSLPGGCAIGARPVNLHIKALERLGVQFEVTDGYIKGRAPGGLKGGKVLFDKITVTGTENVLMAAVLAKGTTVIENAAREPEVTDLAQCLNTLGAKISGIGSDRLVIEGVSQLHDGEHSIIPDRIEAGTFLVAAAATRGRCVLTEVEPSHMDATLMKLEEAGASVSCEPRRITLEMHGRRPRAVDIRTLEYPGFATDMQAQFVAMNAVAEGTGTVTETIFENRMMHIPELQRMGGHIDLNGATAVVRGREALKGAPVMSTDLRASASLVIAGLVADGETSVDRVYHLDRGYERIEEKLRRLGADIERVRV
ncbi:MAG: UDP-N-acetylglucosamine 1-carboxyvinyltransferase [Gammaproteobacteria bacterium]|nr:UDP-N-acetylglucosamine 1-carboxyvinyltransferase [Gammaproteobacteria bacterium]